MNRYSYALLDDDETLDTYHFNSDWSERDKELLAQDAAEDYYLNHNHGWGDCSPRSIEIFKEGGTSLGAFRVKYVFVPSFWAVPEESF